MTLEFFVKGSPAPGGSKTAFVPRRKDGSLVCRPGGAPVVNITDAGGKKNKLWKRDVHAQARAYMAGKPLLAGPLEVELIHFLPRPKAHFRTGRLSDQLRDDAPRFHTQKPDALKLARSTEDALTGALWADDCQTVQLSTSKLWCHAGQKSGCLLRVSTIENEPTSPHA